MSSLIFLNLRLSLIILVCLKYYYFILVSLLSAHFISKSCFTNIFKEIFLTLFVIVEWFHFKFYILTLENTVYFLSKQRIKLDDILSIFNSRENRIFWHEATVMIFFHEIFNKIHIICKNMTWWGKKSKMLSYIIKFDCKLKETEQKRSRNIVTTFPVLVYCLKDCVRTLCLKWCFHAKALIIDIIKSICSIMNS